MAPILGPIGVDLDNTIIGYDELLRRLAREWGLIGPEAEGGKKAVRNAVRLLPDGEMQWQKLQYEMYGPRILQSRILPGVEDFFRECRRRGVELFIISHKTEFINFRGSGVNLRRAAMDLLEDRGFFRADGIGFSRERVFFESTRPEKVRRIGLAGCTHFVDDLEETFLEDTFPASVVKILLDLPGESSSRPGIRVCSSWPEISHFLFHGAD